MQNLCVPLIGACPTPGGRTAAVRLVRIQACRLLKLLRNCLAWRDLLSPESLLPLALGDLVAKRLVPALRELAASGKASGAGAGFPSGSGVDKGAGSEITEALALCERAVELLPLDWMERSNAAAPLASVRITVRLFGDCVGSPGRSGGAKGGVMTAVERVVRLQVSLGDDVGARDLAQRYGLKIA